MPGNVGGSVGSGAGTAPPQYLSCGSSHGIRSTPFVSRYQSGNPLLALTGPTATRPWGPRCPESGGRTAPRRRPLGGEHEEAGKAEQLRAAAACSEQPKNSVHLSSPWIVGGERCLHSVLGTAVATESRACMHACDFGPDGIGPMEFRMSARGRSF